MTSRSFGALLAARQAKAKACGARLVLALASARIAPGEAPGAATAAEFSAHEAFRAGCRRIVREARASFEAASAECAGLELLERRSAAGKRLRRSRSEAREADERNRMLSTLLP